MKAAVITFPGSNCDEDTCYVLENYAGFEVQRLWHKDTPALDSFKLVVLPGGFSYGDYLRCGAMASVSPILEKVKQFADAGGTVLGICNGFQILCEVGLLPGAIARNESLKFRCLDVPLSVENASLRFTQKFKVGQRVSLPIAHGEGRYVVGPEGIGSLEKNNQIVLRYLDNPNGSEHAIAGVCNKAGNVFGLMPHPERATDLRSEDGKLLWASLKEALQNA